MESGRKVATTVFTDHSITKILSNTDKSQGCVRSSPIKTKRSRRGPTNFTEEQKERLESVFNADQYPGIDTRERLAEEFGISESRIQVWFQNRRSRQRRLERRSRTIPNVQPFQMIPGKHQFPHSSPVTCYNTGYWSLPASFPLQPMMSSTYYTGQVYHPINDFICHDPTRRTNEDLLNVEARTADMTPVRAALSPGCEAIGSNTV